TLELDGRELREPHFEVVFGRSVDRQDAATGTIARGKATSPYDNLVIDGSYLKAAAQEGLMTQVLYAVAIRSSSGERSFRSPTSADLEAIEAARSAYAQCAPDWEANA